MEPTDQDQEVITAPAPVITSDEPVFQDPDDIALATLRADAGEVTPVAEPTPAEAEAAATTAEAEAAALKLAAGPAAGDPEPEPEPEPDTGKGKVPMIPKPRLDKALSERDEAIRTAAYYKGMADASRPAAQPGAEPSEPQPEEPKPQTPEEQLAAIRAKEISLANDYESGALSLADLTKQQQELRDQEYQVRDAMLIERAKKEVQPAQPAGSDMRLQELTADLEREHPYVNLIATHDADGNPTGLSEGQVARHWDYLHTEAALQLAEEGLDLRGKALSPNEQYILREKMAELADTYGPVWLGKSAAAPPPAAKPAAAPGPKAPQPTPMSRTAQDRLNAIGRRQDMPVDLNALTGTGGDPTDPSEQELLAMDEETILALPAATRRRLLGAL